MKILEVIPLAIPDVKVIRYARFSDQRGYFTEPFRRSDVDAFEGLNLPQLVQTNESYSRPGTVRGLHFQWNPFMGKLVRTIVGRMLDIVLDIRNGSPTFGSAIAYAMPSYDDVDFGEWIWVPHGFAHGNCFPEDTVIEYFCTGEYNPECEAGISPLANDIDWSLCEPELKTELDDVLKSTQLMTEKDRNGLTVSQWNSDTRSTNFVYQDLEERALS